MVELEYSINGVSHTTDSHTLVTTEQSNGQPAILMNSNVKMANIIGLDWKNMRQVLLESGEISPGGVINAGLYYVFDCGVNEMSGIQHLKIRITDYANNSYFQELHPKKEWYQSANMGFKLINSKFKTNNTPGTYEVV